MMITGALRIFLQVPLMWCADGPCHWLQVSRCAEKGQANRRLIDMLSCCILYNISFYLYTCNTVRQVLLYYKLTI